MPPEANAADSSRLWMDYALADLALAKAPLPQGAKYELLLFHAQQAAEKSNQGRAGQTVR